MYVSCWKPTLICKFCNCQKKMLENLSVSVEISSPKALKFSGGNLWPSSTGFFSSDLPARGYRFVWNWTRSGNWKRDLNRWTAEDLGAMRDKIAVEQVWSGRYKGLNYCSPEDLSASLHQTAEASPSRRRLGGWRRRGSATRRLVWRPGRQPRPPHVVDPAVATPRWWSRTVLSEESLNWTYLVDHFCYLVTGDLINSGSLPQIAYTTSWNMP